jgi:hypothetical protein
MASKLTSVREKWGSWRVNFVEEWEGISLTKCRYFTSRKTAQEFIRDMKDEGNKGVMFWQEIRNPLELT